jgi:hypothetical protein
MRTRTTRHPSFGALLAAAALTAGCQAGDDGAPGPDDRVDAEAVGDPATAAAGADGQALQAPLLTQELDLSAALERTEMAMRPVAGKFVGGHVTHLVETSAAGRIDFTPRDGARPAAPLALETVAIRRGDYEIDPAAAPSTVAADGTVETLRSEVLERVTNTARGVEQRWEFAEEPGTEGDLTVEVAATGSLLAANASGLHFGAAGKLGSKYSHGVWIDSAGNEAEIPARFEDGKIVLTVPHDLVFNTAFPAVLDPTVTAETAVDAPVTGATGATSRTPAVALAGGQALVVWADERDEGTLANIYGARVASDGTVLDATSIAIDTASGAQASPVVTAITGGYLVVWESGSGALRGATVSTGGAVTSLGTVAATGSEPALAGRGAGALLAYRDGNDIAGALYSGGFAAAFPIAATAATEQQPTVAADPAGNYLVAWSDGAANLDLRGQLVTAAGGLTGGVITISAALGTQSEASAAFTGTDFVVAWTNNRSGIDIYGTRVSTAGVVLDTRVEQMVTVGGIGMVTAADSQNLGELACASGGCEITWRDRRNLATNGSDVYGQAFTTALVAAGAEVTVSAELGEQVAPALASDGTSYLAAWQDQRTNGPYQIYGARISGAGAVVDPSGLFLSLGTNSERAPTVINGASSWLTLWGDSRAIGSDIVGVRTAAGGALLDASAKVISNAAKHQQTPRLAQSASEYLAVWADGRGADFDIYARRVDASGNVVGVESAVTTATADQLLPAVASDGTGYLVVWQDRRLPANNFDIYGALLAADGSVIAGDIAIYAGAGEQAGPAVAWNAAAGQYVVLWSDARGGAGTNDIYATRVSAAGAVLDAGGVVLGGAAASQLAPAVVSSSTSQLLAVWDDRRGGTGDIYGGRFTIGASLVRLDGDGFAIAAIAGSKQTSPTVATFATNYAVLWTDERAVASNGRDIYGATVSSTAAVGAEFAVSITSNDEANPTIVAPVTGGGSSGYGLLAYDRFEPALSTRRVYYRRFKVDAATGSTCTQDSQCDSGFCVDGKCCDAACGGSSQADCQACSVARGAAVDGTCGPVAAGRICRGYADTFCDLRETCNGVATTCPDDLGRRQTQTCNLSGGGTGTCPANNAAGAPHVCQ